MARREVAQSPRRPLVAAGSRVVIVVSRGHAPAAPTGYATVPDLIGVSQGDALGKLQDAGLEARVFNDYSDRVARGRVIGQLPVGGASLPEGSTEVLLVSSGAAEPTSMVALPDVVGRTEAEALEALTRAQLSPQVVQEYSPTVPAGIVLGQLPDPAQVVAEPVRSGPPPWVWIAAGLALLGLALLAFLLFGRGQVRVPDVTGVTIEEAEQRIEDAGLAVGSMEATESADAEQGTVLSQTPEAGMSVRRGTAVDLVVAGGIPDVRVPDVVGLEQEEAVAALEDAGFDVRTTEAPSNAVASGQVIQQTPAAGQTVPRGTTVGIVISTGPQVENVRIPNVVGLTRADAEAALEDAGLRIAAVENPSADVAEGVVMSQLPAAGDSVAVGTTVGIVVSSGEPADGSRVEVPDVVGRPIAEAQPAIAGAGFNSEPVAVNGSGRPQNEIVAQSPRAGERVSPGSTIFIFYSSGQ